MRGYRRTRRSPFPSRPLKRPASLKRRPSLFVRHKRWLTFIGALIVFATFVTKEAIQENLRDLNSSLENAQSVYDIERSQGEISDELKKFEFLVEAMGDFMDNPKNVENGDIDPDIRSDFISSRIDSAQNELLRDRDLALRIPDPKSYIIYIDQFHHTFETLAAQKPYDPETPPYDPKQTDFEHLPWNMKVSGEISLLQEMSGELIGLARNESEKSERRYELCKKLSYGLYTIGWGLALAGRLFGSAQADIV